MSHLRTANHSLTGEHFAIKNYHDKRFSLPIFLLFFHYYYEMWETATK